LREGGRCICILRISSNNSSCLNNLTPSKINLYKDLWKATGQEDIKFRNKKKKIWIDWSHIKKRGWGNTKGRLTVESSRKQEDLTIAEEDRS
jgi:hypothetical protein